MGKIRRCSILNCTTPEYEVRFQKNYSNLLCNKHRIQFERHGLIFKRTIYDKNKITINNENKCAEMKLYDKHGNVSGITYFDIEHIPLVSQYKWNLKPGRNGYTDYVETGGSTSQNRYSLHRLIMNCYEDYIDVDHLDGNGLNNRNENLRKCNQSQNSLNRSVQRDSLLGFKNICYRADEDKYIVQIVYDEEKTKVRKQFNDLDEALRFRANIYKRFLIDVNFHREYMDSQELISFYEKNNDVYIDDMGEERLVCGKLFDTIKNKYKSVIIKQRDTEIDKLLVLLDKYNKSNSNRKISIAFE